MQMTLEEYVARFPDRRGPVPQQYAGQWIAWNEDCTNIVAHGADMGEVHQRAVAQGHAHPVLQRIPRAPFVGAL